MNIFKDPAYASLRVLVLIIVFVGIGAFALNASRNDSLSQTGQVIGGKTTPVTTLKVGMKRNAEVKALQELLTKRKFYIGKIDGNFGKDTEEAVKKFQSNYQLKPTGTFGQSWVDENPGMMPPEELEPVTACDVDLDNDGIITVNDITIFIGEYGQTGLGVVADFNDDAVVDTVDLILLNSFFGQLVECQFKVSLAENNNAINGAHVIEVSNSAETPNVPVFAFTFKSQGDVDLLVTEIPVRFTSTEATGNDPDDLAVSATLYMDGTAVGSKNFLSTDPDDGVETIVFNNLDVDVGDGSGESNELVVMVDFKSTGNILDNGDTFKAEIGIPERNAIIVENVTETQVPIDDRSGTAVGEASELRDSGITVALLSSDASLNGIMGNFSFTFTATAFGNDVYVDKSMPLFDGTINTPGVDESDVNLLGGQGTIGLSVITSDTADEGTNGYLIEEGNTETFTIATYITPTTTGSFQLQLGHIAFASSDTDATTAYTLNLDEFITQSLPLTAN